MATSTVPQLVGTGAPIDTEDQLIASLITRCDSFLEGGKVADALPNLPREITDLILTRAGVPLTPWRNILAEIKWDIATNYNPNREGRLGSSLLPGPLHLHTNNFTGGERANATRRETRRGHPGNKLISDVLNEYDPNALPLGRPQESIIEFYEAMASFKQFQRYMDPKQWLERRSRDRNILEKDFRTAMLRIVQHGGMIATDKIDPASINKTRIVRLAELYKMSRLLLELEHEAVPETEDGIAKPSGNDDDETLLENWITSTIDELEEIWDDCCDAFDKLPTDPETLTRCQTFLDNAPGGPSSQNIRAFYSRLENREPLMSEIVQVINRGIDTLARRRTMGGAGFEALTTDLVVRENDFEKRLSVEHFEDKLIDKQINVLDEQDLAYNLGYGLVPNVLDVNGTRWEKTMYRLLADMALINRQRRYFRRNREWADKRPWKQIYQVYDSTQATHSWVRVALGIFEFVDPNSINVPTPPANPVDDNSFYTLSRKIFGFKAVDLARARGPNHGLSNPCVSCQLLLEANKDAASTVIELGCGHYFHVRCIFEFWDQPGRYEHICPQCRYNPRLDVRQADVDQYMAGLDNSEEYVANNTPGSISPDNIPAMLSSAAYNQLSDAAKAQWDIMPRQRYWLRNRIENARMVAMDRLLAIDWQSGFVPAAGVRFLDSTPFTQPIDPDNPLHALYVRDVSTRRLTQAIDPSNDQNDVVSGSNTRQPAAEAARMRWIRRARNAQRRAQLRNQGLRGGP